MALKPNENTGVKLAEGSTVIPLTESPLYLFFTRK
jgi:hypothetical protein